MPQTLDLLATGEVGAWKTRLIVEQFSHLDRRTRTDLDAELARRRPQTMGCRQAAATAKRLAYEADPEAAMARCRKARKDRRVTLRPAPDTMSLLSGLLPVEQGVASLAALQAEATARKANGDQREKEQIMADTLVARITGQDTADDAGFEVRIVLPLGALIRHLDHIHRHSEGGPTTGPNGRGVCERGNYVREMPGWTVRVLDPDSHSVVTTTPTGHSYVSRPPEPP